MYKIKFNGLNGLDIFLIFMIIFLMLDSFWSYYPEIKGSIFGEIIELEETEGKITASSYESVVGYRLSSERYNIEYKYSVSGNNYKSNLITFSANYYDDKEAYVKKYPVGKKVIVYYQKSNPFFAVLEPNETTFWKLLSPLLWLLILIPYLTINKRIVFIN